ncbi:tumor necrosis factor receptor superfamily member 6-like [Scyliorhinus torazame]|uniref:tumor necrosis factor receptor superfamily member 6-like n=1 Tax=Scyliorhinus torazame TaxID=75743 RepID=UPI003B59ACB2
MKLEAPAVLLSALLTVINAYPSNSVRNNAVQNGLSHGNVMGLARGVSMKQRIRREVVCMPGQNKCGAGTYLQKDCNENEKIQCVVCPDNTFTADENRLQKCLRCIQCQEESGHKIKNNCTKIKNTECTCRKNFFCSTSETCQQCHSCKECDVDTEEIANPCTERNDTVCVKKGKKQWVTAVVISVILVAAVAGGIILYCKRNSLPCTKKPGGFQLVPSKPKDGDKKPQEVQGTVHHQTQSVHVTFLMIPFCTHFRLFDIPLSAEDLNLIVMEIEPRKFHAIGLRLGLGEPKVQQIESDYHDDINRQGYEILSAWLQGHGNAGAFPRLIDILRQAKCVVAAENIIRKINPTAEDTTEESKADPSENGTAMKSIST